ncbi:MAG TPA: helix-turn-helix domain-containing protein [Dehalococcoidia bacterium]|nr:helix-turn-helix domain-containing protein [Dehalococcoidia bacterium]
MPNSYDQEHCPVARTLDIVGDRWTLLVIRDISLGRRRFKEIQDSLAGISPNLLADRLKRLEERRMVERSFYSQHPPRAEYLLTKKGRDFGLVLEALYKWGTRHEPREGIVDPPLEALIQR